MNLQIDYLYRDASNYKQFSSIVRAVPGGTTPVKVEATLREHFRADKVWSDILHFRPEELGWPTAYFEDHGEGDDDLVLHELERIVPTDQAATTNFALSSL